MELPLRSLSLGLGRRTGEFRLENDDVPRILLTTPESFDSILCRGKREEPLGHVLSNVMAVVLDEIHLLHGTARGEQVRWLIERLRRLKCYAWNNKWTSSKSLHIIALSATVPDAQSVVDAYLPQGQAIIIPGGRTIETVAPQTDEPSVEKALPYYISSSEKSEKILVFCNKRRRVDKLATDLASILRKLGYEVRSHHGSLGKRVRLAAEDSVRTEKKIVLFTTSTLEIGIDIGDIDLVVLDGPAPNIPALLQRVGRGNRRLDQIRVMACSQDMTDALIHAAMIDASREGWLGPSENGPHYAVVRQQIASYIFQSP